MALLRRMVDDGEVDALVPERVWQELARGLMSARPSRMFDAAARLRRAGAAAARGGPPVGRAAAARAPPRNRHRRAPDAGAGPVRAAGGAAAGALGLPGARPGQGHARRASSGRATSATKAAAPRWRAGWPSGCACPPTAANWPTWWRANTATCTAAAASTPRPCCGCSSAATRCAGRRASRRCCWPANAMRAAAPGASDAPYAPAPRLPPLLQAALAVDTAAVAAMAAEQGRTGPAIGAAIHQARGPPCAPRCRPMRCCDTMRASAGPDAGRSRQTPAPQERA